MRARWGTEGVTDSTSFAINKDDPNNADNTGSSKFLDKLFGYPVYMMYVQEVRV